MVAKVLCFHTRSVIALGPGADRSEWAVGNSKKPRKDATVSVIGFTMEYVGDFRAFCRQCERRRSQSRDLKGARESAVAL
jgi:hypothetical protein